MTFGVLMGLFDVVRHAFGIEIPLEMREREMALVEEEVEIGKMGMMGDFEAVESKEEIGNEEMMDGEEVDELEVDGMDDIENPEDEILYSEVTESIAVDSGKEHRVRGVWSYAECFPDIQDVQIVAAQKYGITPVKNRMEAEVLVKRHQLVNICHSPFYAIDNLTHSIPYLVPRAQHLLNTICLNFIDSCQVKGLPIHLPIVTSVLRTTDDVSNLQRGNKNATTNSCHCYGTTVDIAYNKFMPMTGEYESEAALLRWNEPMKQVLSEVLNDLRKRNLCYVKYERKQGCFHLTCR